jgi:hypothetical protein
MNNSTRYKDHPTTTGVGGTNGRESKVAGLVCVFLSSSSSSITLFVDSGSFFSGAKKKLTEADGSLDLSNGVESNVFFSPSLPLSFGGV